MSYFYEAEAVRQAARGGWLAILEQLAPALGEAIEKAPRHVDCPFPAHGGKKDFRLFRDAAETGGGVCTCGTSHDGFEMLMKINGWSFKDALREVGDLIGAERKEIHKKKRDKPSQSASLQSSPEQTTERGKPRRTVKGRLLAFGPAPYRFDEKESCSFFAKVEIRKDVETVLWSVDLERALGNAGAQTDDIVVLRLYEKQPVTIQLPKRKGSEAREQTVHKNIWECQNLTPRAVTATAEQDTQKPVRSAEKQTSQATTNEESLTASSSPEWLEEAKAKAAKREKARKRNDERIQGNQAEQWGRCIGINSSLASPVHSYLRGRGITLRLNNISSDDVRFSSGLDYYEENEEKHYEKIGVFPALVAAVRSPEGEILTLHRTYLTPTGEKANVENPRKMMAVPDSVSLKGGAIRLGEPDNGVLGVSEGLETALAATQGTGIPCWSTVNAVLLAQFEPPANVHTVVVFADKDHSNTGEVAAEQLRVKLEASGIKVKVLMPQQIIPNGEKGIDWNDVLVKHGMLGFPPRGIIRALRSA